VNSLWLRNAELEPGRLCDVRLRGGRVAEIVEAGRVAREPTGETDDIDAAGGALVWGLNDHHIHLFALAAAWQSVACGPPDVATRDALADALAQAAGQGGTDDWIRGVGYHECVAGPLDRVELDALLPGSRPLRVQHRTGAMWILNSAALERVTAGLAQSPEGLERDASGRPTGRVYAEDAWLRTRLGDSAFPDLAPVGRFLASCGVVGVTDATPDKDAATLAALADAGQHGALPQALVAMGGLAARPEAGGAVMCGEHKIMLRERALPEFGALVERITAAHDQDRGVAFHCVARSELVLAAAALRAAGVHRRDRIEHASIAPDDLLGLLVELGVAVVTQPGFVYERGDVYLRDVDPADLPWLYRGRGFLEAGVPLGGGSDAPYGDADPWLGIRAAVDRRTRAGETVGAAEGLSPERALGLFTSALESPGVSPGPISVGDPADLCLLDCPWSTQREALSREHVRATFARGRILHLRGDTQVGGAGRR